MGAFKHYRTLLSHIDSELREDNIKSLKFLCDPHLGTKKTSSNFSAGWQIFEALERNGKLSEERLPYLCELLYVIERVDLATWVDPKCDCTCRPGAYVDPFRVMLFKLSEELTYNEVSTLRFLYAKVPKRLNINDGLDLFQVMLQLNDVTPTNLELLRQLLEDIKRHDLCTTLTLSADCQEFIPAHIVNEVIPVPESSYYGNNDPLEQGFNELNITTEEKPFGNGESWRSESSESDPDNQNLYPSFESSDTPAEVSDVTMESLKDGGSVNIPISTEPAQAAVPADNTAAASAAAAAAAAAASSNESNNPDHDDQYTPLESYKMDAVPRGICVIIDNQQFKPDPTDPEAVQNLGNRDGSDKDSQALRKSFERLQFQVDVRLNMTDAEMVTVTKEYSCRDHRQYDCFVCCILSHGGENHVFGVNGRKVELGHITSMFRAQSCPSLAKKPKLFFMACCRGKQHQPGMDFMADTDIDTDKPQIDFDPTAWVPNESDFLYGYATVANYVSYRSKSQGTFYINELTEVLDKYAHKEDLQTLLLRVNDAVSKKIYSRKEQMDYVVYKQTPAPQHTLRKLLKFL